MQPAVEALAFRCRAPGDKHRPAGTFQAAVWLVVCLLLAVPARANSPLLLAAYDGKLATVQKLLDAGAAADRDSIEGSTALMVAASRGHRAVVELLVQRGAKVDRQNDFGWTALMMAISQRKAAVARFLLEQGADPALAEREGRTGYDFAVATGFKDLAQKEIPWLLATGRQQVAKRLLTTPAGNNALETFHRVLELDPGNAQANRGLESIADGYLALAQRALQRRRQRRADGYVERGLAVIPGHPELLAIASPAVRAKYEAEAKRLAAAAAEKARLEREQREQAEAAEAERLARAEAAKLRQEQERARAAEAAAEAEWLARAEAEKVRRAQEQLAREKAEKVRLAQERLARAEAEKARRERERLAREQAERDRLERERLAREEAERVRQEQQRLAQEAEEKAQRERERAAREQAERAAADLLAKAQAREAAGDLAGGVGLAKEGLALAPGQPDLVAWLAGAEGELKRRSQRLAALLDRAGQQFQSGAWGHPPGGNAAESYQSALEIEPGNAEARAGLDKIADRYAERARREASEGQLRTAMATVAEALEAVGERAELRALSGDLNAKAEQLARLLNLGRQQLGRGQLVNPPGDNALDSYRQVLRAEANNTQAKEGMELVAEAIVRRVAEHDQEGNLKDAVALAKEGRQAFPEHPELRRRQADLQERAAQVADLLAKADDALASVPEGTPSAEAALLFRQVQSLDRSNQRAVAGIADLRDRYLASATKLVRANELEQSLVLLRAGIEALGDFPALSQLVRQVDATLESQRVAKARAQEAKKLLAAGRLEQGLDAAESGLKVLPSDPVLLDVRQQIYARLAEVEGRKAQVNKLLAEADAQWASASPGTPEADAVILKYRAVNSLDPRNMDALKALNKVRDAFMSEARAKESAGDLEGALRVVNSALGHFSSQPDIREFRDRLTERVATARANRERVAVLLAEARLRSSRFSGTLLDFQSEVRNLARAAQKDLELRWRSFSSQQ